MNARELAIVDGILDREGWPAYSNRPEDRGGPTKGGITLDAWRVYTRNPNATPEAVRRITLEQAREFYAHRHIRAPRFDEITDPHLRELVIDAGVHHGPRHAAKWLQWAADVAQDGRVGPITLAAVNGADPNELYLWLCSFRIRLFGRLIGRDPELKRAAAAGFNLQATWAGGWNNRVADFLEDYARRLEAEHGRD